MKKFLSILAICFSLIGPLNAQTSGFAPVGAEWYFQVVYSNVSITQPEFGYMRYRVTGLAEVQGHTCSVIGNNYVYEENNVVYWYNQRNDAFTVLYDYNAEVGDTWYCDVAGCTCLVTVTNVGSVIYNGHTYRTQYVTAFGDDNYPYFDGRIISGIGYEKGLFPDVYACYGGCIDCDYISYIRCYLENGEMLYHQGSYDCDYIPGVTGNCWNGTVAASYAGGDGTSDNPYLISNGKQLALLAQQTNNGIGGDAYYKLTRDINLQKCSNGGLNPWTSIGTPEHPFTGHFDGNGKYLDNLYQCQNTAYKGLFGYTDGANIRNLNIFSCMIGFESEYAGAFVGYANQTNIINCHVYQGSPDYLNTVYSKYGVAGGIVGTLVNGTVKICSNYAKVQTTIQSNGEVSTSAGGIVGNLIDGVVSDCFNRGSVSGLYESSGKSIMNIGGIVGVSTGNVHNVYNAASVSNASNQHCGEIVGYDTDSLHYLNCYWKQHDNNQPVCGNPDISSLPGSTSFIKDNSTSNWGILNEPQYGTSILIHALNLGSDSNCSWDFEYHYPKPYYHEPTFLGSEWYYEITNDNGSITYQYLAMASDTIINDHPIHILVRINTLYDKSQVITHEYIYEENNKVYWWNKTLGEFTTLYDFGAEVGDEWEIKVGTQTIQVHVDAAQTVTYKSQEYKMLSISDPDDIFTGDIICGIGHLTSFFPEKLMTKGYRVEGIRCFWQDGELVYQNGDQDCDEIYEQHHLGIDEIDAENEFVIYPNPSHNVLFVKTCQGASLQSEYRITNIMGQTLMIGEITSENQQIDVSSLPEGMYFVTIGNATTKFMKK